MSSLAILFLFIVIFQFPRMPFLFCYFSLSIESKGLTEKATKLDDRQQFKKGTMFYFSPISCPNMFHVFIHQFINFLFSRNKLNKQRNMKTTYYKHLSHMVVSETKMYMIMGGPANFSLCQI